MAPRSAYQASTGGTWQPKLPVLRMVARQPLRKRNCHCWQLKFCCVFNEDLTAPRPATLAPTIPVETSAPPFKEHCCGRVSCKKKVWQEVYLDIPNNVVALLSSQKIRMLFDLTGLSYCSFYILHPIVFDQHQQPSLPPDFSASSPRSKGPCSVCWRGLFLRDKVLATT